MNVLSTRRNMATFVLDALILLTTFISSILMKERNAKRNAKKERKEERVAIVVEVDMKLAQEQTEARNQEKVGRVEKVVLRVKVVYTLVNGSNIISRNSL